MKVGSKILLVIMLASFSLLVFCGLSGSSMEIGLNPQGDFISTDFRLIAGKSRPIRSDEWLVLTPKVISQYYHDPQFPIINKNIGPDGQNMLVIGMTGVPVFHISAIAKPATWGFFFMDLHRALAWYWWFPIFAVILVMWWFVVVLTGLPSYVGFFSGLIFASSAYVFAWSNWPAYLVFFPMVSFCLFVNMIKESRLSFVLFWGVGLGLSIAGFVFTLYPPWQVTLGSLFALLTFAYVREGGLYKNIKTIHYLGLAITSLIVMGLLLSWWYSAGDAIVELSKTIYPGQRVAVLGGDLRIWEVFRGYYNQISLYISGFNLANQSESASFYYFFPLVILVYVANVYKKFTLVESVVMFFCLWVLAFDIIGFGRDLVSVTQWGRVPTKRTDLSLGLASMILMLLYFKSEVKVLSLKARIGKSFLFSSFVAFVIYSTPDQTVKGAEVIYIYIPLILVFILSFALVSKWLKTFLIVNVLCSAVLCIPYNPVVKAPSFLKVSEEFKAFKNKRTKYIFIGTQIDSLFLQAAGYAVYNGVFFYPQKSLWASLDPEGKYQFITNRYQHFLYNPDRLNVENYKIELPQVDVVLVTFNPEKFNFRLTLADVVIDNCKTDYLKNSSLRLIERKESRCFYEISKSN